MDGSSLIFIRIFIDLFRTINTQVMCSKLSTTQQESINEAPVHLFSPIIKNCTIITSTGYFSYSEILALYHTIPRRINSQMILWTNSLSSEMRIN